MNHHREIAEKLKTANARIAALEQENAMLKKAHEVLQRHPDIVGYYEGMMDALEQERDALLVPKEEE